jgi:hypothetical protein
MGIKGTARPTNALGNKSIHVIVDTTPTQIFLVKPG